MPTPARPVVLIGCGRLGSAIVEGWLATGALDPADLIILSPSEKPIMVTAAARGARINPPMDALANAAAVVLSVKPARWRETVGPIRDSLAADTVIVSVMAGVLAGSLSEALDARPVVRVMPTTAVATGQGVAAVWSDDAAARAVAHTLFDAIADTVDLKTEPDIDAATAVAGSGPAYVHAFTRALAEAGVASGLDADSALRLARGAVRSAASGDPSQTLDDLIARIASPAGTTEAGLKALNTGNALATVVEAAVAAALARARELTRD